MVGSVEFGVTQAGNVKKYNEDELADGIQRNIGRM
jgi:hypothetical protein